MHETPSAEENEEIFDSVADNTCPQQPKQKLFKEQRNQCRKQDLKPERETDKRTERVKKENRREEEDEETRSSAPQHVIEVEINIIENSDGQKTPSHPVNSKRKSTTPQRVRRKPRTDSAAAAGGDSSIQTAPSSPSQASFISESAAEELCQLRNYYSKQLRRINYISHEYLGQPAEPGVLACIREPLRSLRLPGRVTIAETARSLWTRVSGRRKLIQR
ncbi:uncharacterized protein LKV04_020558 [Tautogolabrus adspersus]